ncbi:hypothetical protein Gogos_021288, partial [Gossypium gossypioides]|nr:hypothetical protein [Gossypium gossypioides]
MISQRMTSILCLSQFLDSMRGLRK